MFSTCTVPLENLDSKETELGFSDQEAFPSEGRNAGVILVSCRTWKVVWIFLRDWMSFVPTKFSVRVTKIT